MGKKDTFIVPIGCCERCPGASRLYGKTRTAYPPVASALCRYINSCSGTPFYQSPFSAPCGIFFLSRKPFLIPEQPLLRLRPSSDSLDNQPFILCQRQYHFRIRLDQGCTILVLSRIFVYTSYSPHLGVAVTIAAETSRKRRD
jgi:hypothetical protein